MLRCENTTDYGNLRVQILCVAAGTRQAMRNHKAERWRWSKSRRRLGRKCQAQRTYRRKSVAMTARRWILRRKPVIMQTSKKHRSRMIIVRRNKCWDLSVHSRGQYCLGVDDDVISLNSIPPKEDTVRDGKQRAGKERNLERKPGGSKE
jgi:hypothetical protein